MADFKLALGTKATDQVTGFHGIITGRCDYLTGCNQYLIQPQELKDHSPVESRWLDENRLTPLPGKPLVLSTGPGVRDNGADKPAPRK